MIVATDFDGTLFQNNTVCENDLKAIKFLKENNVTFIIVTGRSFKMIEQDLKKFGLRPDYLICNNGGIIFDERYNVVNRIDIDYECATKIVQHFIRHPLKGFGVSDGINFGKFSNSVQPSKFNTAINPEEIIEKGDINSFYINTGQLKNEDIYSFLRKFDKYISFFKNVDTIDVVAREVSKASALQRIKQKIGKKRVITIGDNHNDLSMIEKYEGYAIKGGECILHKYAKHIVNNVYEVVEIIQRKEN